MSHVILSFVVNIISVSKHYFITTKYFDQSSDIAVFEWRPLLRLFLPFLIIIFLKLNMATKWIIEKFIN